jgi:hypothetical protein
VIGGSSVSVPGRGRRRLNPAMVRFHRICLEAKYDEQFTVVFEAIRDLMIPRSSAKRRIGFAAR